MSKPWSGALIASSLVVSFATLGLDSFWLDEAYGAQIAASRSVHEIWAGTDDPVHPPLFYVLMRWSFTLLGPSEAAGRLPAAIASAVSVALIGLLACRLNLGLRTALLAGALLALAPLHLWYAQDARMYSTVAAMGILFAVGLTLDSIAGAAIVAASLALAVHTDFTAIPLALAVVSVWLVWWSQSSRSVAATVRTGAAIAVGLWLARGRVPQLLDVLEILDRVAAVGRARDALGIGRVSQAGWMTLLAAIAIAIAATAFGMARAVRRPAFRRLCAAVLPIGFSIATVVSAVPRGYGIKQVVTAGWPFVVLAVAWALTVAPVRRWAVAATLAVSAVAGAITVATPRADWRGVVAYLNRFASENDAVWLDPAYNAIPYDFYRPARPAVDAQRMTSALTDQHPPTGRVWLVAERFGRAPSSASEEWLDRNMALERAVGFARLELRLYTPRAD